MKKRTFATLALAMVISLIGTWATAEPMQRPGDDAVMDAPDYQFGLRVDPVTSVITVLRSSRAAIDGSFSFNSATCTNCAGAAACLGDPSRSIQVVLTNTSGGNLAAGYGVFGMTSSNFTIPGAGVTYNPNRTTLANNAPLTITFTGDVLNCDQSFNVYFSMCDNPPGSPTNPSCGETLLLNEPFNYPNGALAGNGSWTTYSGTGSPDIQVTANRAVGNNSNAPDDHSPFVGGTTQPTSEKTYAAMVVTITTPTPGSPLKPVYFAELKDSGSAALLSRVYVLPLNATGAWTFGISHSSTSATVGVTPWSGTTLSYNTDYLVVFNYDPTANTSTLWVDPLDESSTSVTDTNLATTDVVISHFGLRQSTTASTLPASPSYTYTSPVNFGYSVDWVKVGDTFTGVAFQ